jgi:hypothetical protein
MDVGAVTAAIQNPARATCLTAAMSAGGPGFAGDIDPATESSQDADVHGVRFDCWTPQAQQPSYRRPGSDAVKQTWPARWIVSTRHKSAPCDADLTGIFPGSIAPYVIFRLLPGMRQRTCFAILPRSCRIPPPTATNRPGPLPNVMPAYMVQRFIIIIRQLTALTINSAGLSVGKHQRFNRQDPRL